MPLLRFSLTVPAYGAPTNSGTSFTSLTVTVKDVMLTPPLLSDTRTVRMYRDFTSWSSADVTATTPDDGCTEKCSLPDPSIEKVSESDASSSVALRVSSTAEVEFSFTVAVYTASVNDGGSFLSTIVMVTGSVFDSVPSLTLTVSEKDFADS